MRSIASFLCVALFVTSGTAVRADDGASALLAKHKAFVGWEFGDGSIKTLRIDGTSIYGHSKERPYHALRLGTLFSESLANYARGFNGNVFWKTDDNGFTLPMIGEYAHYLAARNYLFAEGFSSLAGTMRPSRTINGTRVSVVRVQPANAFPIDLAIDDTTGALRSVTIDPAGNYERELSNITYAQASPGKRVISGWQDGETVYAFKTVEANTTIAPAELGPPPRKASWSFGGGSPSSLEIRGQRLVLPAKINGVDGRFLLDTGAGAGSAFTRAFAAKAAMTIIGTDEVTGIGGDRTVSKALVKSIAVGASTLHDVRVTVGIPEISDVAPDGIIGYDLFAGAIVDLDLDNEQISIHDPAAAEPDASAGVKLLLDLSNAVPVVPIKLNGAITPNAMLDSGNPMDVLFHSDVVYKNGLRFAGVETHFAGVGHGQAIGRCGTLDKLELGPIVYSSLPACSLRDTVVGPREMIVGMNFLLNFNMTFDYPHATLILSPRTTNRYGKAR